MDDLEFQRLLRDQLPALTAPTAPKPDARQRVREAVARRRHRQRITVGASVASALALVVLVPFAVTGRSGSDGPVPPADSVDSGRWQPIAPSPLSPRNGSASVWTGEEMLVVGGDVAPPCPAGADCVGPTQAQLRADGAAYDPDTDTWRSIAPAPAPFTNARAAWTGEELIVLDVWQMWNGEPGATRAYDPDTDTWRELDAPPDDLLIGGVWNGDELVFWQSEERANTADWSLDPSTGQWTEIPADPFAPTFDRAYVWTGDRFVFVGLDRAAVGDEDKNFQVAEYDPASRTWTRLPDSPVGFGATEWFFHQGYVVNPYEGPESNGPPTGGAYDPVAGVWTDVPQSGRYTYDGCSLPPLGSAGDWLAPVGGVLYSLDPAATVVAPDCPQLPEPAAGAWTGEQVIIWGGPDAENEHNTDLGLTWTPPNAGD